MVALGLWLTLSAQCAPWCERIADADETQLRLRVAWGGGARRAWHGTVSIQPGSLSELRTLGIEADEPGSMWIDDQGRLQIAQRSTRTYDAFDVLVSTKDIATSRLDFEMRGDNNAGTVVSHGIALAELVQGSRSAPLDDRGNRLVVRRSPGDMLRVQLSNDSLVFSPAETWRLTIHPQLSHLAAGANVRIHANLATPAGDRSVWSRDYDVRVPTADDPPLELALEVNLPEVEGVYDLNISATERGIRQRFVPAVLSRPIADRKVQVVVVSPDSPAAPVRGGADWQLVSEIDPANPTWWRRSLQLPQLNRIPGWPQGPLRHGNVNGWPYGAGTLTKLQGGPQTTGAPWEAFPLAIDQPGTPHVLEVELPGDAAQHLGISILEPNAAGAILPIGVDSGVYIPARDLAGGAKLQTHRIVFWPRTRNPLVLLTQREADLPVIFGKLRVYSRGERLPRMASAGNSNGGARRLVAGYLDRPLFPENFSAAEAMDASLGQTVDDWETFYQGGTRLVDYLQHAGQNGLMLSVLADGSAIYPSGVLASTPRYDTGLIGTQGRDPIRKDVLELLFRLFDRERLALIPAVHFSAPLPRLEAMLHAGGAESVGIAWIGQDGAPWLKSNAPVRELAPYYNPLNEHVQQAMLEVVQELVQRYAGHESFRGLAVPLSVEGYAQLLGPEWGLDDQTVAQFERNMQVRIPVQPGENPYQVRARHLLGEHRSLWLQWRAQRLTQLYRRMQAIVQAASPEATLYLAPINPFDSPSARRHLRPALPQQPRAGEALMEAGLSITLLESLPSVTLLRPHRMQPPFDLSAAAIDLQVRDAPELQQRLAKRADSGTLFYHPPQRLRLESFDAKSPYGATNTYTLLVSQPLPLKEANRQRYVRSLAMADVSHLFDGGWLLPTGQEDALRPMLAAFRQLPPVRFETSNVSRQPIVVRTHSTQSETYLYMLNDAPWPVRVKLQLDVSATCQFAKLGETETPVVLEGEGRVKSWTVDLAPYDLAALRGSLPNVQPTNLEFSVPPTVEQQLDQQIQALGGRAAALEDQPPLEVLENPGFEKSELAGAVPGWRFTPNERTPGGRDTAQAHAGKASLRWTNAQRVSSLQSNLFDTPASGRLAVSVWLRVNDPVHQPALRLVLEGPNDGASYYRFAQVGAGGVPLNAEWTQYIFPVEDLPLDGMPQMRVRFDMMSPGEVWLDEVQLFHLKFSQNERIELSKILVAARGALRSGELSNCLQMLEGYWPQFLARHVPPSPTETPRNARLDATKPPESPPSKPGAPDSPGTIDRLKQYVPRFMRF